MSIGRTQAEALADGFLNNLGGSKPSPGELPIVDAVLTEAAQSFIESATTNLDRADAVNTGTLSTQLTFLVEQYGEMYVLSVGYDRGSEGAKYYDFTNKGVQGLKGTNAPASPYKFKTPVVSERHAAAIEKWLKQGGASASNINPKHPASGLERKNVQIKKTIDANAQMKSLAYAVARSTKASGLKPTHYFDDAIKQTFDEGFFEALQIALGAEVRYRIRQFKDEFK